MYRKLPGYIRLFQPCVRTPFGSCRAETASIAGSPFQTALPAAASLIPGTVMAGKWHGALPGDAEPSADVRAGLRVVLPAGRISRMFLELQENGYRPILAHPERYDCVKSDPGLPERWKERQVLLQINKGSLLGEFGKGSLLAADRMEFQYGSGSIERLLKENPARALEGKLLSF